MIGALTDNLGSIGNLKQRVAILAASVAVLGLMPATALANDPATHQYSSNLTQVCVGGEIVTTAGGGAGGTGTGAGGAGGSLSEVCGGGGTAGGGGVGDTGGAGVAGSAEPGSLGSLPFTGLDVGLLAAVAVALLAGGLLLRRRRSDPLEA